MSTTWNPADETGITLTGGNLIATASSFNFNGVRSTTKKSAGSGKWYFEITTNAAFSDSRSCIGWSQLGSALNSMAINLSCYGVNEAGTACESAGFDPVATSLGNLNSRVMGFALDMMTPQGAWWVTYDGTTWVAGGTANPATGVGGVGVGSTTPPDLYITAALIDSGCSATLNTVGGFTHSVPAGFVAWDSLPPLPPHSYGQVIG